MQAAVITWFQGEGVGHEAVRLKEVQIYWGCIEVAVDVASKEVFGGGEEGACKQKQTAQPFSFTQVNNEGYVTESETDWMQRGKEPNLRNLKEAKEMLGLKTSFLQPKPKKPLRPPKIPYSGIVFTLQTKPRSIWRHTLKKSQQNFLSVRVILTLQKFEISNFACCQIVPICSLISELFLFLL